MKPLVGTTRFIFSKNYGYTDMNVKLKPHKVQRIGYSLYVCLPKIWAESVGLSSGSLLDFQISEKDELIVSVKK